jgi:hypothetical protein
MSSPHCLGIVPLRHSTVSLDGFVVRLFTIQYLPRVLLTMVVQRSLQIMRKVESLYRSARKISGATKKFAIFMNSL